MEIDKIILKIKERIEDLNYLVNNDKSSEISNYAWRYARLELERILNMLINK